MLRQHLAKEAPIIYDELIQIDELTSQLTSTNCSSRKDIKRLCARLRAAGFLDDFDTYALQVAALRADRITWPQCYCGKRVNMFNGTFRTFCSRRCSFASPQTQAKIEETNLAKFGVKHPWNIGEVRSTMIEKYTLKHGCSPQVIGKQKRLDTWQQKYGCHPMQTPEILKKALGRRFSPKIFILPSGREITLMGFEPNALHQILNDGTYLEADFDFDNVPPIFYGKHRYFPDFWLPKYNLIVEVKSTYTGFNARYLPVNILKEQAVKGGGFDFQLWVWDPKTKIVTIKTTFKS